MQPIVFVILCLWAVYSSQRFMQFSIKAFANTTRRIMLELPKVNITLPSLPFEPIITLPRIYLDDVHEIIMLFP
jgi:hypothetical protein